MMACQEAKEASLKKAKANTQKTKACLEEIEAVVETGLEEMQARMDVFGEKLDKTDYSSLYRPVTDQGPP
jgi:hypothetical protein